MRLPLLQPVGPALAHLLLRVGSHFLPRRHSNAAGQILQHEARLQIAHVRRADIEGQPDYGQRRVLDVDAVLVERLHVIVVHVDAAVGAQERKGELVARAIEDQRIGLLAAVFENSAGLGEPSYVRLHVNVGRVDGRWRRVHVMAQSHPRGESRNVVSHVHPAGPGANHEHFLVCER